MISKTIQRMACEQIRKEMVRRAVPVNGATDAKKQEDEGYVDGLDVAIDVVKGFPADITYCEALARIDDMVRASWKIVDEPATHEENFGNGRNKAADKAAKILQMLDFE